MKLLSTTTLIFGASIAARYKDLDDAIMLRHLFHERTTNLDTWDMLMFELHAFGVWWFLGCLLTAGLILAIYTRKED